jgi:hypothetical protein
VEVEPEKEKKRLSLKGSVNMESVRVYTEQAQKHLRKDGARAVDLGDQSIQSAEGILSVSEILLDLKSNLVSPDEWRELARLKEEVRPPVLTRVDDGL